MADNRRCQQGKVGVDEGPEVLIKSGLLTQLSNELGYKLHGDDQVHLYPELLPKSKEDDPPYRNMKNPLAVSAVTRRISHQTYEHSSKGRMTLTLGGDHSIAIGTVSGVAKATRERLGRETAVIWVDAHADINTPEASDSGNIHGMPVAFLTGIAKEEREEYFGWITDDMRLNPRKLVYIGLRDVDLAEKRILREHGIKAFSMFDIDRYTLPCPSSFPGANGNGVSDLLIPATELAVSSKWPLPILAATRRSTCPSTSTPWTPSGPQARAPPSVVD